MMFLKIKYTEKMLYNSLSNQKTHRKKRIGLVILVFILSI